MLVLKLERVLSSGSAIGVGLIIRAYQLGETTHVAIYEYSVFIFGPLFGWWLLGQGVTASQSVGIGLIAAARMLGYATGRLVDPPRPLGELHQ